MTSFDLLAWKVGGGVHGVGVLVAVAVAVLLTVGLRRSSLPSRLLIFPAVAGLFYFLHELLFNVLTYLHDPSVVGSLSHDYTTLVKAGVVVGLWFFMFQGEFSLNTGRRYWIFFAGYCVVWLAVGLVVTSPYLPGVAYSLGADAWEIGYTLSFAGAFAASWKRGTGKVVGELPRMLR